jgi:hypothetical protein
MLEHFAEEWMLVRVRDDAAEPAPQKEKGRPPGQPFPQSPEMLC